MIASQSLLTTTWCQMTDTLSRFQVWYVANILIWSRLEYINDFFQTPEDYEKEYTQRLQEERYQALNLTEFIIAGSEFDAIWSMALGLHNASEIIRMNDSSGCDHLPGKLVPLEEFNYLNDRMGCVLRNSFQQVNFRGITVSWCCLFHLTWWTHVITLKGPVVFNSNGSRDARVIRVQQYHVKGNRLSIIQTYLQHWVFSENGSVERPTVADVIVNTNSSLLIFKENFGVSSIWAGKYSQSYISIYPG